MLTRRRFAASSFAAAGAGLWPVPGAQPSGLRLATMDTVFRMAGNPEAVGAAKRLGLAGVQVTLGRSKHGKTLPLEDKVLQSSWTAASREHGVPLNSTY